MPQGQFYRLILRIIGISLATILISRYTWGYGFAVVAVAALYFAFEERPGPLFLCALFMHIIIMSSPILVPRLAVFASISRMTLLLSEALLIFIGIKRLGRDELPLKALLPFIVVAFISSINGYFPLISFFKLGAFLLFLFSISIGVRNIISQPREIEVIRAGIIAFSIIIVYGSILTLPFPSIAYYTSLRGTISQYGAEYANSIFIVAETGVSLFTGVAIHSQFFGPLLASIGIWLLCDMLLVERRISLLHTLLLGPLPILLYMTRARIALFTMLLGLIVIYFYLLPRIRLQGLAPVSVRGFMSFFMVLLLVLGVVLEMRGGYLSKWVRKTEDVRLDQRSFTTAVTDSRQGVIEECMADYRKNRLFGTGFQVIEEHRGQFKSGRITLLSAPQEKGVLPIMILGETGIVGLIAFIVFLIQFFTHCHSRMYLASIVCFTVFLGTNAAEATFFSPGGGGGVFWMICAAGGFVIDMASRGRNIAPMPFIPSNKRKKRGH